MTAALTQFALLPADRQSVIILAFWVLVGAGVVVSVGAWILLRRESRAARPPDSAPVNEPPEAGPPETEQAEAEPPETEPAEA
jgi:hypothetical protein